MAPVLRLRPLRPSDEDEFVAAHRAMAADDGFMFGLFYEPGMPWENYLADLERHRRGVDLAPERVSATFLAAEVDGAIVGRASVRHELNDYLAVVGGHIGYGVIAEHRRRGYATEILQQSLIVARAAGVDRILVTCDEGNAASQKIIERNGGLFDGLVADPDDGHPVRRYWID